MKLEFNHKNTKVRQLTEYVQKYIAENALKVGDKLPSINHLSRSCHVSRDTVFKAFLMLKDKGIVDSIHGKNYYVTDSSTNILLLLDEYSPFKEALYNRLIEKLPSNYKVDLWFHQYNKNLFEAILKEAVGRYSKYLVMNYDNEKLSDILTRIDKRKLLLIDFGKFDKEGYSFACQDFDEAFYNALDSIKSKLKKYKKIVFVFNKHHKHPASSKEYFCTFCLNNAFEFEIVDEITAKSVVKEQFFYLVIKPQDVVEIVKKGKANGLKSGRDYGLLAYNDSPFYEVIENGISSIGIDWEEMGNIAANFVKKDEPIHTYLPTKIIKRDSF